MDDPFFGKHTIFDDAGNSRTPYMTRIWIGRLRLHIFYRGDNDPDPHDHPWDFWTFPLTSYVEEVTNPCIPGDDRGNPYVYRRVVERFRLHYRMATHCHRVLGRHSGWQTFNWGSGAIIDPPAPLTDTRKIVTIVWRGKSERSWGFLRDRNGQWCWTPWKEYVFGGGKHAPCEPVASPSPVSNVMGIKAAKAADLLRSNWSSFCDADAFPGSDTFADAMEEAGYIEIVPVSEDALEEDFAAERGIEPGGMMYRLTESGRAALSALEGR